jgi:hypothetical protein
VNTPDLFEITRLLGNDRVMSRIEMAIKHYEEEK